MSSRDPQPGSIKLFSLSNKRHRSKSLKNKNTAIHNNKPNFQIKHKNNKKSDFRAMENTKKPAGPDSHYVKTLQKALREALDENDVLRERVTKLEALLSAAQDEIEERDQAILDLSEVYQAALALIEGEDEAQSDQGQGDNNN